MIEIKKKLIIFIFVKYRDFSMIFYKIAGLYQDLLSNVRTYQNLVDTMFISPQEMEESESFDWIASVVFIFLETREWKF